MQSVAYAITGILWWGQPESTHAFTLLKVELNEDNWCPLPGLRNHKGPCPIGYNRRWPAPLWKVAVEQGGLDRNDISLFGQHVPKYTKTEVDAITKLDHQKTHLFNFQGSACRDSNQPWNRSSYRAKRNWVMSFAQSHFTHQDVLFLKDKSKCNDEYFQVEKYDYSTGYPNKVDGGYFQVLAKSNITLCPGGDDNWSVRVWEAALTRSMPMIKSKPDDWNPGYNTTVFNQNLRALECLYSQYEYTTLDNPVYDAGAVERNFKAFIRYQTFIEGDNTPPGCNLTIDPKMHRMQQLHKMKKLHRNI